MSKPLIILDSGHAEYVSGKQSPDGTLKEWDFNNQMQYLIKPRLEELGFDVYLTNPSPKGKNEIGLSRRASLANSYWVSKGKPKAVFVSLHANAYGMWTTANGVEVFHAKNSSDTSIKYASIVCKHIHNTLKSLRSNSVNRGVKCENFTVIYKANMPSILIEYAFYTNKQDLVILKNNKKELAESTIKALCECFGITYSVSSSNNTQSSNGTKTNYTVKVIYEGSDGLNVRKDATVNSSIVDVIYKGGVYTIVEEKNGWGKLKSGIGWISLNEEYVEKITISTNNEYTVKVIYKGSDGLNVRTEPSIDGKIVTTIHYNEVYTIVKEKNGWGLLKSYADNENGWISLNSNYIQKN